MGKTKKTKCSKPKQGALASLFRFFVTAAASFGLCNVTMYTFSIFNFDVNANKVVRSETKWEKKTTASNNGKETLKKITNKISNHWPCAWRKNIYIYLYRHTKEINRTQNIAGARTENGTQHMKLRTKEVQAYHKLRAQFYLNTNALIETKRLRPRRKKSKNPNKRTPTILHENNNKKIWERPRKWTQNERERARNKNKKRFNKHPW